MEETPEITTAILRTIRDDLVALKGSVASLEVKFTDLEVKFETRLHEEISAVRRDMSAFATRDMIVLIDARMDRLHARLVENDVRATTAHHETQRSLARLMDFIDAQSGLEGRIERCELDTPI